MTERWIDDDAAWDAVTRTDPFYKCANGHQWPVADKDESFCPECGEDWRTREWPIGLPGTRVVDMTDEKYTYRPHHARHQL